MTRDPAKAGRNWYVYCDSAVDGATDGGGYDGHQLIGPIRRGIAKGQLPPGTGGYYQKHPEWREKLHRKLPKTPGKKENPNVTDEEVWEVVNDNLPPELQPPSEYEPVEWPPPGWNGLPIVDWPPPGWGGQPIGESPVRLPIRLPWEPIPIIE